MAHGESGIDEELRRYREMLGPLVELPASGPSELPAEERRALEAGVTTLRGYHGDHIELEEAVAAFARALWTAPAAGEPRAWIALALLARSRHWPDPARAEMRALARGFADRAFAADPGGVDARIAWCRVRLADGQLDEAARVADFLPADEPTALALRSDLAEARGDRAEAIRLRERELEREREPLACRAARNQLALLYQRAGRLDEAVALHAANLTRHPDYAWGRVNLASALEGRGDLLDAFAEVEAAVALGLAEAGPYLDELGQKLDRASLARFRTLLRGGRDGEAVDWCPSAPATREG